MSVYTRIAKWNAARYDQVFDKRLALELLEEEYREALDAEDMANYVKELCDIMFVAYGAMWKLGVSKEEFVEHRDGTYELIRDVPINFVEPLEYIGAYIVAMTRQDADCLALLHSIVHLATGQLSRVGIDQELGIKCLEAVCDSNESKTVQKVASDVKAGKGPYYKPAEPKIQALLDKGIMH